MKKCTGCLEIKPEEAFGKKSSSKKDGLAAKCRDCYNLIRMSGKHSLTPEEYLELLEKGCAVCGITTGRLCLDHDHKCCPGQKTCGKCIRGVLCDKHNRGLGYFDDDIEAIRKVLAYLESYGTRLL